MVWVTSQKKVDRTDGPHRWTPQMDPIGPVNFFLRGHPHHWTGPRGELRAKSGTRELFRFKYCIRLVTRGGDDVVWKNPDDDW